MVEEMQRQAPGDDTSCLPRTPRLCSGLPEARVRGGASTCSPEPPSFFSRDPLEHPQGLTRVPALLLALAAPQHLQEVAPLRLTLLLQGEPVPPWARSRDVLSGFLGKRMPGAFLLLTLLGFVNSAMREENPHHSLTPPPALSGKGRPSSLSLDCTLTSVSHSLTHAVSLGSHLWEPLPPQSEPKAQQVCVTAQSP